MKHYNTKNYYIEYPFAEFISENTKYMKLIIEKFIKISHNDLISKEKIFLICRGSSGAMVSVLFFNALRKKYKDKKFEIMHIKKDGEKSHRETTFTYEYKNTDMYIWVDDFISEGHTLLACYEKAANHFGDDFKFDYAVCSRINCDKQLIKHTTKNLVAYDNF